VGKSGKPAIFARFSCRSALLSHRHLAPGSELPAAGRDFSDAQLRDALTAAGLPGFVDRLDEQHNWAQQLSGGEQQRVHRQSAAAKAPPGCSSTKATSALDEPSQEHVYELLHRTVENATIISIAHRSASPTSTASSGS